MDQFDSALGQFLDEWAEFAFFMVVLALAMTLGAGMAIEHGYAKGLLSDDRLYFREKDRFDQNPNGFQANHGAADTARKKGRA